MDRQHDNQNGLNPQNPAPVRPDFNAWEEIRPAAGSWLHHPLLMRGGATAIAIVAIIVFAYLAQACLRDQTLGETARILGSLAYGAFIFAIVAFTARVVQHETTYASDQTTKKRPPQPGDQPGGP